MIFEILFSFFMVIWSRIVSVALSAGMNGNTNELWKILSYGILFFLFMMTSFYFQTVVSGKFVSNCVCDLKEELFKKIIYADANTYTDYNCAKYISIFNNDIELVSRNFFRGVPAIFAQLLLSIIATVALFMYNKYLALFQIAISIITGMIPALVNRNSSRIQKEYMDLLGEYNSQMKDYISSGVSLKSYHIEEKLVENHNETNKKLKDSFMKVEKNRGKSFSIITGIAYFESALFIILGAYLIASGRLDVAFMLGAMQLAGYVSNPVNQAATLYDNYKRTKLVILEIEKFLHGEIVYNGEKEKLISEMPLKIEHLSFSYGEKEVLNDLSVYFEKGKKYAIIGESGCGKSTLIKIIMKQINDYTGDVYVGKQNSRKIDMESFSKYFVLIQQEAILFEDTLWNNITMYGNYSEQEVSKCIQEAGLDKYVNSLSNGLQTLIHENAINCSGGERKRIMIARALLRKTPVLVMDEATDNLDIETANQIENRLLENKNLTLISITHKTNEKLTEKYDEVYRLRKGKLCLIERKERILQTS
jgi:ATP-binding cassette subfamily C protein